MFYERIVNQGMIADPNGKPNPNFALSSTVNWMRALRLLAEDEAIDFKIAIDFYKKEGRRKMSARVENTVFEQLFLGLHHLSALQQFSVGNTAADYARVSVLAWYYGISNAASAMTAVQSGSFQDSHAGTARLWDEQIARRGLAMTPFSWRVSSLVEKTYKSEVDAFRGGSAGNLRVRPITKEDALGAAAEYLSGSARWYAGYAKEEVKRKPKFKALGASDFRKKAARVLRDDYLDRKPVGFIHQASRYRGKANYREALFLAYGPTTDAMLVGFVEDMHEVLKTFLAMAGAFACRRLGKDLWNEFVMDVDAQRAFTTRASDIWV